MEWEARLFQLFEARILAERINQGFLGINRKPDVEGFLKFARSVGNTRFSRAGWAFEHHVATLLRAHGVVFESQAVTEEKKKPDFLFPGAKSTKTCHFPVRSCGCWRSRRVARIAGDKLSPRQIGFTESIFSLWSHPFRLPRPLKWMWRR